MEPVLGQLHNREAVLTFGALQVLVGILLVILDIAVFIFDRDPVFTTVFGSGIWAGVFFILTGTFGIVAGQHIPPHQTPRNRRCYLITALVLSVFGLLLTLVLAPVAAIVGLNSRGFIVVGLIHTALFSTMFVISLGQMISTSVNIHKISSTVSLATIIMTSTTAAPDPRAFTVAVLTHPAAVTVSGLPPPYAAQQQAYVYQATATHPK